VDYDTAGVHGKVCHDQGIYHSMMNELVSSWISLWPQLCRYSANSVVKKTYVESPNVEQSQQIA